MAKIIILRGNSGSGKTTTAKRLQKKLGHGTMLISQDVVRREILYVKEGNKQNVSDLLFKLAMFGKANCEFIILEGILTLRRHKNKLCSEEFGEAEMKTWWNDKDFIKSIPETLIGEELSVDEIVNMIYQKIKREET